MTVFNENNAIEVPFIKGSLIYFLIKKNKVVYVGQTKNGLYRPFSHYKKDFDKVYVLKCRKEELDIIEDYYILKYKPIYNKQINDGYALSTCRNKLREMLNDKKITIRDIKKAMKNHNINYLEYNNNSYLTNEMIIKIYSILKEEKYGTKKDV